MSGKEYYNFLVLGAEATGKTCLCSCFSRGLFLDQHVPTIDVPVPPFCRASAACVVPAWYLSGFTVFSYFFLIFIDSFPAHQDEYKKTITYGTEVDLTIADLGGWFELSLVPFVVFFFCCNPIGRKLTESVEPVNYLSFRPGQAYRQFGPGLFAAYQMGTGHRASV